VGADHGLGANSLGHGKGLVKQAVENDPHRPAFRSFPVSGLDLAQNLGLAHHHGIKAGSNSKEMLHRVQELIGIETRFHLGGEGIAQVAPKQRLDLVGGLVQLVAHEQDLHPVAGGQYEQLIHITELGKPVEQMGVLPTHCSQSLPDFNRSGLVVHSH